MKLFVQARKDGYNVLYPKPTPAEFFQFAGDIRPDSNEVNLLGKAVYTLSFANEGCIYTKHIIIRDVQRQGLGNIGFSIFISNNKKLSGFDIIKLLDELLITYCINYCPDFYLANKPEDWSIFEAIKNQYKEYDCHGVDNENCQPGTDLAAFIYYIDKKELGDFFNNPFQEQYSKRKQVFFVEKNLEGKSDNPLNALQYDSNANLTGQIDLKNQRYTLYYNQQAKGGLKIEVESNRILRVNGSKIKSNEVFKIKWSKAFCIQREKEGTWSEIGRDFLDINDNNKTITVREISPDPIKHFIKIQTVAHNSPPITDAVITLKSNNSSTVRQGTNNIIEITAEEFHNKCYLEAVSGDLKSHPRYLNPEDLDNIVYLTLLEHKSFKFLISGDKGPIDNFTIQISGKEDRNKSGYIVFSGKEIEREWLISVSHRDYETNPFEFVPKNENSPVKVNLSRRTSVPTSPKRQKYRLCINPKKGKRSSNGDLIPDFVFVKPNFECDAKFGYRFEKWVFVPKKPRENYDGSYKAVFEELWYRKVPAFTAGIFAISMVAVGLIIIFKPDSNSGSQDLQRVNEYVKGIEFNLDTLKEYKKKYCDSTTINQSDGNEKGWWQKIWIFESGDSGNSTNGSSVIPDFCSKIDNAITIRTAINLGKIDELKVQIFSESQQNLKNSIDSIDDKYKKQIGDTLNELKVSVMNLNEVADLILKTQSDLKEKETVIQKENEAQKNTSLEKQNEQKNTNQTKTNNQEQQKAQTANLNSKKHSLDKAFWDLVNEGSVDMVEYKKLLNDHKSEQGELINYLKTITQNDQEFRKFKNIPELKRKKATELQEIKINE